MPIIGLNDSSGARIQEGVDALAAYSEIFNRVVKTVTQQDISFNDLGAAGVHSQKSGVAHFMVPNDILNACAIPWTARTRLLTTWCCPTPTRPMT